MDDSDSINKSTQIHRGIYAARVLSAKNVLLTVYQRILQANKRRTRKIRAHNGNRKFVIAYGTRQFSRSNKRHLIMKSRHDTSLRNCEANYLSQKREGITCASDDKRSLNLGDNLTLTRPQKFVFNYNFSESLV